MFLTLYLLIFFCTGDLNPTLKQDLLIRSTINADDKDAGYSDKQYDWFQTAYEQDGLIWINPVLISNYMN